MCRQGLGEGTFSHLSPQQMPSTPMRRDPSKTVISGCHPSFSQVILNSEYGLYLITHQYLQILDLFLYLPFPQ